MDIISKSRVVEVVGVYYTSMLACAGYVTTACEHFNEPLQAKGFRRLMVFLHLTWITS